ncbi:hypothetical protein SAMN04324257_01647 [Thermoanaerobacter thermohydrosulfuricus]|nr:hypothetical protein SAMN04324257_01647 [Thermoanaerobacter thermohydrosulfuricus]
MIFRLLTVMYYTYIITYIIVTAECKHFANVRSKNIFKFKVIQINPKWRKASKIRICGVF